MFYTVSDNCLCEHVLLWEIHEIARSWNAVWDQIPGKCIKKYLKKNELYKLLKKSELEEIDTKFWTSASSAGCPKNFGWCGSYELLDYESLGISRKIMNASKQCLTATFSEPDTQLSLKEDDCAKNKAKAICEVN